MNETWVWRDGEVDEVTITKAAMGYVVWVKDDVVAMTTNRAEAVRWFLQAVKGG